MLPIAIACGDHSGIGPEVALKAVAAELSDGPPDIRFTFIGLPDVLRDLDQRFVGLFEGEHKARVQLLAPEGASTSAQAPHAIIALDCLTRGVEGCARREFAALVTAPVSKEAIIRAGVPFVGQTEFIAGKTGTARVTMMLLGDDPAGRWLRVALATTHVPLRRVPDELSVTGIEQAIAHAAGACQRLRLPRARVAVCGLNPHAGEGGMLGDEEQTLIAPAIQRSLDQGIEVVGPISGDTAFHAALNGEFDAVVAMYHDQGLAPLKAVAFESGVNWTLGLPFPRVSPDHGTAFDIAGRGIANPASMRAAIRMAIRLARDQAPRGGAGGEGAPRAKDPEGIQRG